MALRDLFVKKEALVSIDIGSSGLKLVELDISSSPPQLLNIAVSPLSQDVFSGNIIAKPEEVVEQISQLLEAHDIGDKGIVTALPGPSVFTKRIKMAKAEMSELATNIQFEAGNFIPHPIDAVKLDFHVIRELERNQLEVLVVAVKNEIIDSFVDCLGLAGLQTRVVDVDFFAIQNIFELSYPELVEKTVALVNIGSRYSSINITRGGDSLFSGDVSIGGKAFTEALAQSLNISQDKAEELKRQHDTQHPDYAVIGETIDHTVDFVANELNRQMSFFWNATGAQGGVDRVMVSGGGALVPTLLDALREKTGIEVEPLDPFKGIDCGDEFDASYLAELKPHIAVALGLGLRTIGDKVVGGLD